jgi:uncharacterized membrane protein
VKAGAMTTVEPPEVPLVTNEPAQPGEIVRALRPTALPLRWLAFRERILLSAWCIPTLFLVGAFVVSGATLIIDSRVSIRGGWLPGSTPATAQSLASTIATGMLTFTAVVFSSTIVAIQLAGGQYSPRAVRVFARSALTHITLGIFLATFVVALNTLVQIREGVDVNLPTLAIILLYVMVIATLIAFIMFCQGIIRLLRVQYLMDEMAAQGRRTIEEYVPAKGAYFDASRIVTQDDAQLLRFVGDPGVLQAVDMAGVVALAVTHDVRVECVMQVGQHLGVGVPIARVSGANAHQVTAQDLLDRCMVGGERTLVQDPGFSIRQLVDIAIRALSPAVNDPTTGVQAIDHITDLLAMFATRPDPTGCYVDADGLVRVVISEPDFSRMVTLGYTEIALFGANSPQIPRRLLAAYERLEVLVDPSRRVVLTEMRRRLLVDVRGTLPHLCDDGLMTPDRLGFG